MKFFIENLSKNSGRLGNLVQAETGKEFRTPILLQATKGGSIPYLSRDGFDKVTQEPQLLQLSLATMDHMCEALKQFKNGMSAYIGYKDSPTFLTIRDPCELMPSGFNDKDMVPLFCRRGKAPLTLTRYVELVEAFQPDIYQGLCDADTNWDSAKKRIQKSVDRTDQFMGMLYAKHQESAALKKCSLFAPICGGFNKYARSQSIKHAKTNGETVIGGFIFEGFHNYGLTASEVSDKQLLPVMEHCINVLGEDASSKPLMMPGSYTPLVILELIKLGVDMFDSSYAYCAAVNFKALSYRFDLAGQASSVVETPFIDITDDCIKEDFTPLLKDCACLACQKHTRAYIHHLYKTSELLGPILLMIHNLHHLLEFFKVIHSCIAQDNLSDLLHLIRYQGGDKCVDYQIKANTKVISRAGLGKGFAEAKE